MDEVESGKHEGGLQEPLGFSMQSERFAPLREAPPNDYRLLAIVSIFFCPLVGSLAFVMSYLTNKRFEADELKRAEDASRDAKFSAIMAIFFGVAIVLFCIFIFAIVPALA